MARRSIFVVTGSRSEYGILHPLLQRLAADKRVELGLVVTGAHLLAEFGSTWRQVRADGFRIVARLPILRSAALDERAVARAVAAAVDGFSRLFAKGAPDLLVLLGDRYETLGAASAALAHRLVVAHISGGKTTEGAIDESIRHAVTKLSHYHFTHNETFRRRLLRMGEAPKRVFATGSPLVDEIASLPRLSREETLKRCGLPKLGRYAVVLFHPETLAAASPARQAAEVLRGAERSGLKLVLLYPGAEAGSGALIAELKSFAGSRKFPLLKSLPRGVFLNLLRHAEALIGNSSAGVTDAPTLGVPAVNVGGRQDGMLKARNVIDCAAEETAVFSALRRALRPGFRASLNALKNPYGDGKACARIAAALATLPLGPGILRKSFYDGEAR